MNILRIEPRPDRVAVVSIDTPSSPVNLLSRELLGEIGPAVERVLADPAIDACVLVSGKKTGFVAGADLKALSRITGAREAEALSRSANQALDRIAASPKPFVAAIHGAALGGGLEIALACHARVATDDPATVLALPEVQLGLLPGGGGTQRLPRLVGLPAGLGMILTGENIRARKAIRLGLVDRLVPRERLIDGAAELALSLAKGSAKLKRPGRAIPARLLLLAAKLPVLGSAIFKGPRAGVLRRTRGHYPAPLAILRCVEEGLRRGIARGAAEESRLFGELVVSPEAKSLVWLFLTTTALRKPPEGSKDLRPRTLLVLGAGLMGEGIASVSLPLTNAVVRDPGAQALDRLRANVEASLERRLLSGSIATEERDRQRARLKTVRELSEIPSSDAGTTDLVIEAVFEDLGLKRKVLAECEALIRPDAIFASNTSALPISEIAKNSSRPERVLGMHYFSPVPKMPLLEIVVTPKTSPRALAVAHGFGAAQGKAVIVVKDSPGFYTTRILGLYLAESIQMLEEGASIEEIDRVIRDFGFPVGPIALLDEVGIDIGAHVATDLGAAFAHREMKGSDLLKRIAEAGFSGRKNGKGFYLYGEKRKGPKPPNPEVTGFLKGPSRAKPGADEIRDRIVLTMVNEAVHCLEEGVIASARDGDAGAVLGLGFPPFRGGPFRHIDSVGALALASRLKSLAQAHGKRFAPAALLEEHARTGRPFHELSPSS